MENILIYGSGGHAKVIIDLIEASGDYCIKGIIDIKNKGAELYGYRIFSPDEVKNYNNCNLIIGIGDNRIRRKVAFECHYLEFPIIKSKFCNISAKSLIGKGSVIMPGVCINVATHIGENCIFNTNCSIDHDCSIGDFVHISPNAVLCGNVTINEGTHIGAGATIIPGITIGKWCTIGAGSVVIRNIPDNSIVVGNPGKIIKHINNE